MKFLLLLFMVSCVTAKKRPEPKPDRVELLSKKLASLEEEALEKVDKFGWLVSKSCDALLWTGKYGAFTKTVSIGAAEGRPGKFYRTPSKTCYAEGRSGSECSRDMSMGLLTYLLEHKDLDTIERHLKHGAKSHWIMCEGKPSRTLYSPALISLWYKAAVSLGYKKPLVHINNLYPKGLEDYQAHLQMMDIAINGELDKGITATQLDRVLEHAGREPDAVFYQVLKAIYKGPVGPAVDMCLDLRGRKGSYVRCDDEDCELAEHIYSCNLLLKFMGRKKIAKIPQ